MRKFVTVAWLAALAGCANPQATPLHFATLQDYLAAEHRDLASYYYQADPDALMKCYAGIATSDIPPEIQPDLLTAANKAVAGQALTASEADLKAKWLDARPRPEGNTLHVEAPRALWIVREMAVTCPHARFSN
jgi:hypothetical protein